MKELCRCIDGGQVALNLIERHSFKHDRSIAPAEVGGPRTIQSYKCTSQGENPLTRATPV